MSLSEGELAWCGSVVARLDPSNAIVCGAFVKLYVHHPSSANEWKYTKKSGCCCFVSNTTTNDSFVCLLKDSTSKPLKRLSGDGLRRQTLSRTASGRHTVRIYYGHASSSTLMVSATTTVDDVCSALLGKPVAALELGVSQDDIEAALNDFTLYLCGRDGATTELLPSSIVVDICIDGGTLEYRRTSGQHNLRQLSKDKLKSPLRTVSGATTVRIHYGKVCSLVVALQGHTTARDICSHLRDKPQVVMTVGTHTECFGLFVGSVGDEFRLPDDAVLAELHELLDGADIEFRDASDPALPAPSGPRPAVPPEEVDDVSDTDPSTPASPSSTDGENSRADFRSHSYLFFQPLEEGMRFRLDRNDFGVFSFENATKARHGLLFSSSVDAGVFASVVAAGLRSLNIVSKKTARVPKIFKKTARSSSTPDLLRHYGADIISSPEKLQHRAGISRPISGPVRVSMSREWLANQPQWRQFYVDLGATEAELGNNELAAVLTEQTVLFLQKQASKLEPRALPGLTGGLPAESLEIARRARMRTLSLNAREEGGRAVVPHRPPPLPLEFPALMRYWEGVADHSSVPSSPTDIPEGTNEELRGHLARELEVARGLVQRLEMSLLSPDPTYAPPPSLMRCPSFSSPSPLFMDALSPPSSPQLAALTASFSTEPPSPMMQSSSPMVHPYCLLPEDLSDDYLMWSIDEVSHWLRADSGTVSLVDMFQENSIRGVDLPDLDGEILLEMGLAKKLDRIRVLRRISELQKRGKVDLDLARSNECPEGPEGVLLAASMAPSLSSEPNGAASSPARVLSWRRGPLLGAGAFGKVFLGVDHQSGRLLAIKEITVTSCTTSAEVQKQVDTVENEIALLQSLHHPNIVSYIGSMRKEGDGGVVCLHIIMEYVPGGSLADLLAKVGGVGERIARRYTSHILAGLQYLHSNSVVHRDIKGANILVSADQNGTLKLADFGSSRVLANLVSIGSDVANVVGTAYFMAPEVVRQEGHGSSADIWSAGCTVIEMLTGHAPWYGMPPIAAMFRIGSPSNDGPPLPSNVSFLCCAFIRSCCQKDRQLRPTASTLLQHPWLCHSDEGEAGKATDEAGKATEEAGKSTDKAGETATEEALQNTTDNEPPTREETKSEGGCEHSTDLPAPADLPAPVWLETGYIGGASMNFNPMLDPE